MSKDVASDVGTSQNLLAEPLLRSKSAEIGVETKALETISIYDAFEIVGSLHDLRVSNPARLLEVFSSATPKEHVLRNLLVPSVKTENRHSSYGHTHRHTGLKVGDKVYAKLGPFPLQPWATACMAQMGLSNPGLREYYLATIESIDDKTGECTISWDHPDDTVEVDLVRRKEDLIFAGSREWLPGAEFVVHEQGQSTSMTVGLTIKLGLFVLCVLVGLQAYASCLLRVDGCDDHDEEDSFSCSATRTLKEGGAFSVGLASLCFSFAMYKCVLPMGFQALRLKNAATARVIRKFMVATIQDALVVHMLPNVTGRAEEVVVMVYFTIILSFTVFTLVASDVGILAFGSLMAARFMTVGNAMGEKTSILQLREKRFLAIAKELRAKLPLGRMTPEQLEMEVARFFGHDAACDMLEISLEMTVILVAGTQIALPDSQRIRYFILPDSYLSDYVDMPTRVPEKFGPRRDMIVDLFAHSLEVPGISTELERYVAEGARLPFFFALQHDMAKDVESQLRDLGLPLGHGAFTWRCAGGLSWLAHESSNIQQHHARAEQAGRELASYGESLVQLARAGALEECRALLLADADPNYHDAACVTAVFLGSQENHVDLVDMLLNWRADPNIAAASDGMSPLVMAAFLGHVGVVQLLLEKGADVRYRTHDRGNGGHAAMDLAHHSSSFLEVASLLVPRSADLNSVTRDPLEEAWDTPLKRAERILGAEQARHLELLAGPSEGACDTELDTRLAPVDEEVSSCDEAAQAAAAESLDGALGTDLGGGERDAEAGPQTSAAEERRAALEALQSRSAALEGEQEELRRETDDMRRSIDDLTSEGHELRSLVTALGSNNDSLRTFILDLEARLEEVEARHESSKAPDAEEASHESLKAPESEEQVPEVSSRQMSPERSHPPSSQPPDLAELPADMPDVAEPLPLAPAPPVYCAAAAAPAWCAPAAAPATYAPAPVGLRPISVPQARWIASPRMQVAAPGWKSSPRSLPTSAWRPGEFFRSPREASAPALAAELPVSSPALDELASIEARLQALERHLRR